MCSCPVVSLSETAENLVHGLCQAFEKRGLPRALMSDNGSAMTAAETVQGLERLGIIHEKTLPYSAYQNGKQEVFWAQVEGRLLAMLESCIDLTLAQLNEATLAWIELEYNRKVHSEIAQTPLARYTEAKDVGRPCPDSEHLRQALTAQLSRAQRQSDGTLSVEASALSSLPVIATSTGSAYDWPPGICPMSISPTPAAVVCSADCIHKTSTRTQTDADEANNLSSTPRHPLHPRARGVAWPPASQTHRPVCGHGSCPGLPAQRRMPP